MTNKWSRKGMPSWMHKKKVCVSMKKPLLQRVDEMAEKTHETRSELIERVVELSLHSEKGYAHYMLQQAKLNFHYWEYELQRADAASKLKKESDLRTF